MLHGRPSKRKKTKERERRTGKGYHMEGTVLLYPEEQELGVRREQRENRPGSDSCSSCVRGRGLLHLPFFTCKVRGSLLALTIGGPITDTPGSL